MDFPPNFSFNEMTRSATAAANGIHNVPLEPERLNLLRVAWFLQGLKDMLCEKFGTNVKIHVSSGYRCPALNKKVGGAASSAHMRGLAADITCSHLSPYELAVFIAENMVEMGYDKVINEFDRWVHVGLSDDPPRFIQLTARKVDGKTKYLPGLLKS